MSTISTFDCLPNELIIGVFDYLEPAESFQSFFDYNDRLRKLVKFYVKYNRHSLNQDIERFSRLHSWYKHLNYKDGGITFYIIPLKGEQVRHHVDPQVSDYTGIHWHFWRDGRMPSIDNRIQEIIRRYPVKLNPSFSPYSSGDKLFDETGSDFIRQYYPEQFQRFETTIFPRSFKNFSEALEFDKDSVEYLMKYIKKNEPTRLRNSIRQAAKSIWKELQALEDVNILEILTSIKDNRN